MKIAQHKVIEWFLRLSISAGFLSAVADRFGIWPKPLSAWGSWDSFLAYTRTLNPLLPVSWVPAVGVIATLLEVLLAIGLLLPVKTPLVARCSGILLLVFALAMMFTNSMKAPLDYSVFSASAAAFGLSVLSTNR